MKKTSLIILLFLPFIILSGQALKNYQELLILDDDIESFKSNFEEIKKVDVSHFWINNPQEQRHGFIGSNFRRLDIKFLSIIKNKDNPNHYMVYGKSRVSNNICEFQGDIIVNESHYIKSLKYFNGSSGLIAGEYKFYENPNLASSGVFKGKLVTYWKKDKEGNIVYMELPSIAGNNQFLGTWQEYGKNKYLVANWGDMRIPNSGDLDVGTGEFGPSERYKEYGWENFLDAYFYGDKEKGEKARILEKQEWWK